MPPRLVSQTARVRQDFFRDLFLDEVNGKLIEEKNVKLDTMPGKEYVVKTPDGICDAAFICPATLTCPPSTPWSTRCPCQTATRWS